MPKCNIKNCTKCNNSSSSSASISIESFHPKPKKCCCKKKKECKCECAFRELLDVLVEKNVINNCDRKRVLIKMC